MTLLLLVPDSSDNLDELLVKLPRVSLQQLVQEWLPHSEVSVSLPQFTIVSSAIDVTPFLRQLGIRTAFNTTSADLSAATAAPAVHVKSVTQDAFFSTSYVAVNSVGSVSTNLGKGFSTVTTVVINSVYYKLIVVQLVKKPPSLMKHKDHFCVPKSQPLKHILSQNESNPQSHAMFNVP